MTPAFHHVPKKNLEQVIAEGVIRPGIERIHPKAIEATCALTGDVEDALEQIGEEFNAVYGRFPSDTAWNGLVNLAKSKVDEAIRFQREKGWSPTQETTEFTCLDVIAGDLDRVFLSVWDWAWWVPEGSERTGFVFDADQLIEQGACIRPHDMLLHYKNAVVKELSRRLRTPAAFSAAIEQAIARVKLKGDLCGRRATAFLRGPASQDYQKSAELKGSQTELVIVGPLSLELAVEQVLR